MATKHYEWIPGEAPPVLGRHSIAKHKVLQAYLEKYVSILAARPVQEQLKLLKPVDETSHVFGDQLATWRGKSDVTVKLDSQRLTTF